MTYRRSERPPRPRPQGPSSRTWLFVFIPFVLVFVYLVVPGPWRGDEEAPVALCAAGCSGSGGTSAPILAVVPSGSVKPAGPKPYSNQDPDRWMKSTSVAPPQIFGPNAALVEGSCGQLVYGLNQNERRPPASIAKIVTAMVVAEQAKMTDVVAVKINGWDLAIKDGSSTAGLEAGMNVAVEDLLYGLMLPSGNDAALALADHLGGTQRFATAMNERVQRLGLENSAFANPDGRDAPGQYTSALDMTLLGRELMKDPSLRAIAGTKTVPAKWAKHTLWNTNYLVYGYPGANGIKFGYTEAANETIVGSAVRNGRELYVTVLFSDFAYLDAVKLLDWAFANTQPNCVP
jgi:D-alanyl-D-alanine carboxypeptidase (penicillin-binding protein 5/6)